MLENIIKKLKHVKTISLVALTVGYFNLNCSKCPQYALLQLRDEFNDPLPDVGLQILDPNSNKQLTDKILYSNKNGYVCLPFEYLNKEEAERKISLKLISFLNSFEGGTKITNITLSPTYKNAPLTIYLEEMGIKFHF